MPPRRALASLLACLLVGPGCKQIATIGFDDEDIFVAALEHDGTVDWIREYDVRMDDSLDDLALGEGGSIVLAGYAGRDPHAWMDPRSDNSRPTGFVMHLDQDGRTRWTRTLGTSPTFVAVESGTITAWNLEDTVAFDALGHEIDTAAENLRTPALPPRSERRRGDWMLAARTDLAPDGTRYELVERNLDGRLGRETALRLVDSEGTVLWSRTPMPPAVRDGAPNPDFACGEAARIWLRYPDIERLDDGRLLIVAKLQCYPDDFDAGAKGTRDSPALDSDCVYITMLDGDGAPVWSRMLTFPGDHGGGTTIRIAADDASIVVAGSGAKPPRQ